jgi:hypothetical protein
VSRGLHLIDAPIHVFQDLTFESILEEIWYLICASICVFQKKKNLVRLGHSHFSTRPELNNTQQVISSQTEHSVTSLKQEDRVDMIQSRLPMSHPVFKAKIRCSSYVCPGSSCHTYGQNISTEYQCLYYIISYYKNLLQVQKGLNSELEYIMPQAVDRGFRTPRRNLHPHTPHLLSGRT